MTEPFDEIADAYDRWYDEPEGRAILEAELACLRRVAGGFDGRWLEVGVGTGKLHVELARRYTTAGIDLAYGMVRRTRARITHHDLRAFLCQSDVGAIPWPADCFDAVVATFVLSAVPNLERALDEMVRVTHPGGSVVIVDAGESEEGTWFARALARLWEAIGDFIRDEVPPMEARGLEVTREEFGPGGCVHVVAGTVPSSSLPQP